MGKVENVALMTSGGLAPCLSSSIGHLIHYWSEALKAGKIDGLTIRCYVDGYKGILTGHSYTIPPEHWSKCSFLQELGGSPIGNSRVKLTNIKDCIARGLVKEGEEPLEVAARQLIADQVTVIHTIGGDDTNTQAAVLSKYILDNYGGKVAVIGMSKTIDNDVNPIKQTFGADTAAEQGALFFKNVVNESTANPRMLILHECMGRHSGYLTAATAYKYREMLANQDFPEGHVFSSTRQSRDVHAVWIPEMPLNIEAEGARLKKLMDTYGNVNVFMSEGSGVHEILAELEAKGQDVPRDAFGHVKLDQINPGQYFAKRLAEMIHAEKTLVQKSGYFARSAAANAFDKELIRKCAEAGVDAAIEGISGCMGEDEDKEGCPIRACEFERISGGKHFNYKQEWFLGMLQNIGQPF